MTMIETLRLIQPFFYGALFMVAFLHWQRQRSVRSAWLFAAFGILFTVIAAGQLLPEGSTPLLVWARKAMLAVLVLFPYCLYRFMHTFVRPIAWVKLTAAAVTAALVVAAFALPAFPEDGEPRPAWLGTYILLLLVQWVFLTGLVAVRLWRAGRGQPTVARRRMQTMSFGAAGLMLALVVAGEFSEVSGAALVVQLLALAAAPLMLVGLAPPFIVSAWWRRKEETELRQAERALMKATSAPYVFETLLAFARRLLVAPTAILETADGTVVAIDGSHGDRLQSDPEDLDNGAVDRSEIGATVTIPMQSHQLKVLAGSFTPFFGGQEISRLEDFAGLAELALARVTLVANQRLLASIIESTDDAIITKSLDATITSWNPGAERMYGYSREEVVGKSLSLLVPTGLENDIPVLLSRLRAGERINHYETRRQTKDGRVLDVSLSLSPLHDGSGALVGAATIARDVTQQKEMEARLRRSQNELAAAQSMAQVGSWSLDLRDNRRSWSNEFCRIYGLSPDGNFSPEEVLARIHPDDLEKVSRVTDDALKSLDPFTIEYRIRRPDGSERTIEARGAVVAESGKPVGLSGTVHDVTDRRMIEQERQSALEEAERANRAKNDFLSRMSHELRTPLNAVLGFAQLLEMDPLEPEQKENMSEIVKAGRHLLDLINEVLDIARIEAGKLRLSLEPVDPLQVTRECMSLLAPLAKEEGISLRLDDGHVTGYVTADRQRLKQVLLNLITNGIKYNRQKGTLTVSLKPPGKSGSVTLEVRDTGRGIPPHQIERIFAPFERLGAESSQVEGVGLGLALSKSLTEAMGGTISVKSEIEKGTTFSVELEAAKSDPDAAEQGLRPKIGEQDERDEQDERSTATALCRILYIEDNLSNLKLVERLVSRRPQIELIPAMQGGVGLTLARDHQPSLILLDLGLPDIPGEQVLYRLQADPQTASIPVAVITADATSGQKKRLLEGGAQEYLTKPLDVHIFFELIDKYCTEGHADLGSSEDPSTLGIAGKAGPLDPGVA